MKNRHLPILTAFAILTAGTAHSALIAHYTFDSETANTTSDSVGTGRFATLGNRVDINTGSGVAKVGGGALEMLGGGTTSGPGDGAITDNSFTWTTDARTLTFWWRADSPNVNVEDGTFVSFGNETANGTRFDVKEQNPTSATPSGQLRVEVQGTGQSTNPTDFDDGAWHFVAVTVPNNATFADIAWYVDGSSNDLNTSTSTLEINTGTSPLVFGDSILTAGTNNRVPNGFMDDFQLYDEVLTQQQILSLYNNPGTVIPEPATALLGGFGFLLLLRRRR